MKPKKILIVERNVNWQPAYVGLFAEIGFSVLFAATANEGRRLFQENPDLFAASVGSKIYGNLKLVKEMRTARPELHIFAASSIKDYREELRAAGCNHELSDKNDLVMRVMHLPNAVVPVGGA